MPALAFGPMLAILKKLWWSIPMALLLVALLLTRHTLANTKQDRDHWHQQASEAKAALDQTVANYRAAAEAARKADAANKARVEAAQNQATKEVSRDYETRLADLRRRYDALRVRAGASQAHPGSAGTAPVSGLPSTSAGVDAAPAPGSDAAAFNCSANALQLEELIAWIREQAAVPRDKE